MRVLAISAALVLAAAPAISQDRLQSDDTDLQKRVEKLEKAAQQRREEAAEIDKAYQRTMKSQHTDGPAPKVDPWGNIRASDPAHTK
jgi:uncharacterized protein YlxW (UPF0749 family)